MNYNYTTKSLVYLMLNLILLTTFCFGFTLGRDNTNIWRNRQYVAQGIASRDDLCYVCYIFFSLIYSLKPYPKDKFGSCFMTGIILERLSHIHERWDRKKSFLMFFWDSNSLLTSKPRGPLALPWQFVEGDFNSLIRYRAQEFGLGPLTLWKVYTLTKFNCCKN